MGMPTFSQIAQQKQQPDERIQQQAQSVVQQYPEFQGQQQGQIIPRPPSAENLVPSPQQQMMQVGQENPFSAEQYQNVQLPDVPMQYSGGIADDLLNNNEVPEAIREKFWFVFHKDNVLTFLDNDRKQSKLLNFDITKVDMLNSIPYYDYTFERELQFGVLRNVFETKLDRAMGFKGANIKNERIVLQSQFSEQRQIMESGSGGPIKEGFFKRLLGRR